MKEELLDVSSSPFLLFMSARILTPLRGGAHLPRDRFAPSLRFFAPPLKSHAPPLEKVSIIDQRENLTSFGCLGSTPRDRKKVFL